MHVYSGVRDFHDTDVHYLVFGDLFFHRKASYQTLKIRVVYSLSLGLRHMCINGAFGLKNTTELSVKKTFTKHTNQSHFAWVSFHRFHVGSCSSGSGSDKFLESLRLR